MNKLILVLAVAFALGHVQFTQARDLPLENLIISCSKQEQDDKKIECLNHVASTLEKMQKRDLEQGTEFSNKWRITKKESPMDDSKTFIGSLRGVDELQKERATLVLRCAENSTSAYIVWDDMLDYMGNNGHTVEYRIDNNKAVKSRWNLSTDKKATFAPQEIKFAKSLVGAKKLIARTDYYQKSPQIITFDLEGVDGIVKEIQETCHWK